MLTPKQGSFLLLLTTALAACNGQRSPTSFDPLGGASENTDTSQTTAHAADTLFEPMPVAVETRTTTHLPRGNVRCGLADKAGNLWFGAWEGIVRYDPSASSFTLFTALDSLNDGRGIVEWQHVNSIFEDASGKIWFGTPSGVTRYDPSAAGGNAFARFVIPAGEFAEMYDNAQSRVLSPIFPTTVLSIIQDRHGDLWFGTHGSGVLRYDGTSLSRLTTKDGLCHDVVQSIVEDSTGNLWFATRGGGVCRYDGRSFTSFKADDVVGNHVFFLTADRTGVFWIGTVGGGLRRFDGKTFIPVTQPDMLNATCMLEASSGDRWFSSDGPGVVRYDGRSYTRITTADGLCSNAVWSIFEDKDRNLWFCTREGLCRYDPSGSRPDTSGLRPTPSELLRTGGRSFTGFEEN